LGKYLIDEYRTLAFLPSLKYALRGRWLAPEVAARSLPPFMGGDEHVLIEWEYADDWEDLEDIGGSDLFALVKGSRLISIGAFRSDEVVKEVEEVLERIGERREDVQLWAGDIESYPSSLAGDRERWMREVLCALIFSLMPSTTRTA